MQSYCQKQSVTFYETQCIRDKHDQEQYHKVCQRRVYTVIFTVRCDTVVLLKHSISMNITHYKHDESMSQTNRNKTLLTPAPETRSQIRHQFHFALFVLNVIVKNKWVKISTIALQPSRQYTIKAYIHV